MDLVTITSISSVFVAIMAIIGGAMKLTSMVRQFMRRQDQFLQDWRGTPPRPGQAARPGVMQRLDDQDNAIKQLQISVTQLIANQRSTP